MKYAFRHTDDTIIVTAADTYEEFETSRGHDIDILDRLSIKEIGVMSLIPYRFLSDDLTDVKIVSIIQAIDEYHDMMDRMRRKAEVEAPDRRTLAEIHNVDIYDPWAKNDDDSVESRKAMNEQMQKVREAGGLTGESFGGSMKEGLHIGKVNVTPTDDLEEIQDIKVQAIKSTITPYVITGHPIDFKALLDKFQIPENRVMENENGEDPTVLTVRLHAFQTKSITNYLNQQGVDFTITRLHTDEENPFSDFTRGDTSQMIYFSAVFEDSNTTDRTIVGTIAQHDHEGSAWYVFLRRADAEAILDDTAYIIATNRDGKPIIGREDSGFRVLDTMGEETVVEPRPWNDGASELLAMTNEQVEETWKKFRYSEYYFCAHETQMGKSRVHIVPKSYFDQHNDLYDGELHITNSDIKSILKPVEGNPSLFTTSYERNKTAGMLERAGMTESIRLHLMINDRDEQEIASRFND